MQGKMQYDAHYKISAQSGVRHRKSSSEDANESFT